MTSVVESRGSFWRFQDWNSYMICLYVCICMIWMDLHECGGHVQNVCVIFA